MPKPTAWQAEATATVPMALTPEEEGGSVLGEKAHPEYISGAVPG